MVHRSRSIVLGEEAAKNVFLSPLSASLALGMTMNWTTPLPPATLRASSLHGLSTSACLSV